MTVLVRPARTADVPAIRDLVARFVEQRILLGKATVTLYEDVQEFLVAEVDGEIVGCGALHVLWADLAEIRTVAVDPAAQGQGVGRRLVEGLITRARDVGVARVFCLTFQVTFFSALGFQRFTATAVEPGVYEELLQSYDEGVAEFLGLERVKPNILGNTRMLLVL